MGTSLILGFRKKQVRFENYGGEYRSAIKLTYDTAWN